MNMFKSVKATNIKEYIESLPKDRKESILFLDSFIKKTAPDLKPHFAFNMLGYGSFKYKNYKKEEIYWPTVSLANQKNYISLYVCAVDGKEYVAEKHKDKLGKVNVGKSCIRFKKIEDLDLQELEKVIKFAANNPGLPQVVEKNK
jgi:uncharacterized protein YdhG (YjbR/CyaY superfamily)